MKLPCVQVYIALLQ